jgi:DNA-binding transcriptional regulator YdaS (Cro superfamily)
MEKHPIDRAAEVLGSQVALAKLLGVSKGAVGQWREPDRRVPAEHCPVIERETRAKAAEVGDPSAVVTCEQLRPDVEWSVLRTPLSAGPTAEAGQGA